MVLIEVHLNSYMHKYPNVVEKIPEIYEAAVKKKPKNDELLSHLFMAYVRTEDYKKQQQTALALHKVVPSNPYYSWAVMSIVMQVVCVRVCVCVCVRVCVRAYMCTCARALGLFIY